MNNGMGNMQVNNVQMPRLNKLTGLDIDGLKTVDALPLKTVDALPLKIMV